MTDETVDREAVYTVQVLAHPEELRLAEEVEKLGATVVEVWVDLLPVTVPPRTKTRTAIRKALAAANIEPTEEGIQVRILPAEVAEPITVLPPAPQPGQREMRL